jgi:RNA-binding protein YhbY
MSFYVKFQIGKAGVTSGVIESLSLVLKTHKDVRISVLKSSGRDKEKIKSIVQKLIEGLSIKTGQSYTARIIGFTVILRRHSKGS